MIDKNENYFIIALVVVAGLFVSFWVVTHYRAALTKAEIAAETARIRAEEGHKFKFGFTKDK